MESSLKKKARKSHIQFILLHSVFFSLEDELPKLVSLTNKKKRTLQRKAAIEAEIDKCM